MTLPPTHAIASAFISVLVCVSSICNCELCYVITSILASVRYRILVCAMYIHLWGEDGQVSIEDDVSQGVDQWLVVDNQKHL